MLKSAIIGAARPLSSIYKNNMLNSKSLQNVVEKLEEFAPVVLAESWDNVGLLIEPYEQRPIQNILLTNDLTESVMGEALQKRTDLIISYHPPIFAPVKRITQSNWKERIISICLSKSIALYSPHTAWDAVAGGVNDWLSSALPCKDKRPIQPNLSLSDGYGAGRIFDTDISLAEVIAAVQKHIGTDVHVARGVDHTLETRIRKVAVCAGSGGSLLKNVPADLYLTGEMSHHELLDANHRNISVLLCNHSNSERGFLNVFRTQLNGMLDNNCQVMVSECDADPLVTYVKS